MKFQGYCFILQRYLRPTLVFLLLTKAALLFAQQSPTGSITSGSGAGAGYTRQTLHFSESSQIQYIKQLLEQGDVSKARVKALEYVAYADGDYFNLQRRYEAHNMLCAVYIKSGELVEAVSSCTDAIEMNPGKWSAYNNRATAYMLLQDYELARADYNTALSSASGEHRNVRELLGHNLDLLNRRQNPD